MGASGSENTSRRAFLGTAVAAGASALLVGDSQGEARLEWCARPVYPLSIQRLYITRGPLPAGSKAELELVVRGPSMEGGEVVLRGQKTLRGKVTLWDVCLLHNHPELIAGHYEYFVRGRAGASTLRSNLISYDLTPFTFGV